MIEVHLTRLAIGLPIDGPSPIAVPLGRDYLPSLFASLGFTRGAEIGVWKGEFSEQLCLANPDLHLLCVDPWAWYPEFLAQKNHKDLKGAWREAKGRLARYHCTVQRALSTHAAKTVPNGSLDFVFIDGNHAEAFVRRDLEAWAPKIRRGGILAGHDYNEVTANRFSRVKAAVDAYVTAHAIEPWWILTADAKPSFLWVVT